MFKTVVKYENFNGEEKERELYFHLSQDEIAELALDPKVLRDLAHAHQTDDRLGMLMAIRDLVKRAYGIRSEDGERFIKTPEQADLFLQSAVYEEFLGNIITTDGGFDKFLEGVLPSKLLQKAKEKIASGEISTEDALKGIGVTDPFKEPENPISDKGVSAAEDDQPAWMRENRIPTKNELIAMSKTELLMAFRKHPNLTI